VLEKAETDSGRISVQYVMTALCLFYVLNYSRLGFMGDDCLEQSCASCLGVQFIAQLEYLCWKS